MIDGNSARDGGEVDLFTLWDGLWSGRWVVIGVASVFAAVSIAYALLATEWYQAEVVVSPADKRGGSSALGNLGGLASLAGISLGGLSAGGSQEPLAVLKSKGYARQFITEHNLMPLLFTQGGMFDDKVRSVDQDRRTGLVTVTVTWTDPALAAKWANDYVRGLNERLRDEAIREAERNLAYLNKEIATTPVVAAQQSLGRVVESEMQKMLLARGSDDYAYKVIDPATQPNRRYSPRRSLIVIISTAIGGVLGSLFVLLRRLRVQRRERA